MEHPVHILKLELLLVANFFLTSSLGELNRRLEIVNNILRRSPSANFMERIGYFFLESSSI